MKKFRINNDYQTEFTIEFRRDKTKKEVAKLLRCKEEEVQEIGIGIEATSKEQIMHFEKDQTHDEWLKKMKKLKDLLQEIMDKERAQPTSIKPMIDSLQRMQVMFSASPPQFIEETPAMRAAVEQWKRQKLTQEQLERLKEIAKEHANPPTHENTDPWTE